MLSILIPYFHYDCSSLVEALRLQAEHEGIDCEVLTVDDAQLGLGRAAARNHLAEMAHGDLLMFMDCDATVVSDSFLRDCLATHEAHPDAVICPRPCHAATLPSPEVSLRWRYEHQADSQRSAEQRNK